MVKKCKIVPKFGVPDLVRFKRVEFPCIMELNEAEMIRAMNYADLYEQLEDGSEVLLDPKNFNSNISTVSPGMTPDVIPVIGLDNVVLIQIASTKYAGIGKARLYAA